MRILAISGVPGTGKSTLMVKILSYFGSMRSHGRYGLCDHIAITAPTNAGGVDGIEVLGKYEPGEPFGGTDKLSMSVQGDAETFLSTLAEEKMSVAFEGDRLCNASFLRFCRTVGDLRFIVLRIPEETLLQRRAGRSEEVGKEQNETWLKGRESKVYTLQQNFDAEVQRVDTFEQSENLSVHLAQWLLGIAEAPARNPTRLF